MTAVVKESAAPKLRKPLWRHALAAVRHTAGWVLTVATIVLLLAATGLLFLQTEKGLRFLETAISRVAATPDMQIALQIKSFSGLRVQIPSVTLSDTTGVFLQVDNIDLKINPLT